jgi:hypothetical protein
MKITVPNNLNIKVKFIRFLLLYIALASTHYYKLYVRKKRMLPLTEDREKGEKLISPQDDKSNTPLCCSMVRGAKIWPNGMVTIVMT